MTKLYYESAGPKVFETTEEELLKNKMFNIFLVKVSVGYYDYCSSTYYTYDRKIADKFVEYWRMTDEERERSEYPIEFNLVDRIKILLAQQPCSFNYNIYQIKSLFIESFKKYILRRKV